jgi:hypothetical protein
MRINTRSEFKQWQSLPVLPPDLGPIQRETATAGGHFRFGARISGHIQPPTAQVSGKQVGGGRSSRSDCPGENPGENIRTKLSKRTND